MVGNGGKCQLDSASADNGRGIVLHKLRGKCCRTARSTTCCARLSTACISAARIPTTGVSTACFQFRQRYGRSRSCYGNRKLLPVLDSVYKYGMSFDVHCRNHSFRDFHEKGKSRRRVGRYCRCGTCCFHSRSCSCAFVFLHLRCGVRHVLFGTLLVLG